MKHIKSPDRYDNDNIFIGDVFLAGSIEMGTAEPWQERLVNEFKDTDIRFLNPRRDDWDSSWVQEASNPQFAQQVNWELDALDYSDLIVFNFDPDTKSPITLMELGLYAASGKVIVCCPDGFWRKGNVEIVCQRHNVTLVNSFDELVNAVKKETKFWAT
jgi:nucleoside 2-deoxyribosyltransferase